MVRKPKLCCFILIPRNRQRSPKQKKHKKETGVRQRILCYSMVYLISFLESFVGISHYFYDFIKCFNVSLHLGLFALKYYHDIGTYIGLKIHGFVLLKWFVVWLHCKKDMELSHMIFRELIGRKCLCDAIVIIL